MIKRNVSLPRLQKPIADPSADQFPRRRSPIPLPRSPLLSPTRFRSPPGSPRTQQESGGSPTLKDVGSAGGIGSRGFAQRFPSIPGGFRHSIGNFVNMSNARGTPEEGDCAAKGPRSFFRTRYVPSRKVSGGLCMLLCIFVGGRWLARLSKDDEAPLLRGRRRGKGNILWSYETPYCNAHPDHPAVDAPRMAGDETSEPLELRQLQVTIRHGDRSAIHDLPGTPKQRWSCLPFSTEIEERWRGISRFDVYNVEGNDIVRTLWPEVYTDGEHHRDRKGQTGTICKPGQLTEVGIRQHLTLGDKMRQAYSELLTSDGDLTPEEIYVRSTDYTRTLQSAAAFLMSFFPGTSKIAIITNENEDEEIMHGVGYKSSSKDATGGPETVLPGSCRRASKLSQRQRKEFRPREDVQTGLVNLFGPEIAKMKMTEVADNLHAMSCHNMTLPCSDQV